MIDEEDPITFTSNVPHNFFQISLGYTSVLLPAGLFQFRCLLGILLAHSSTGADLHLVEVIAFGFSLFSRAHP
jgi:hypothetical protein